MNKEKKRHTQELVEYLKLQADNKLPKEKEYHFNWLLQIFTIKELTETIKKFSYENYKSSSRGLSSVEEQEEGQRHIFRRHQLLFGERAACQLQLPGVQDHAAELDSGHQIRPAGHGDGFEQDCRGV